MKFKLRIERDEDASNPRDDDNIGTMVCFHRRYQLGDKNQPYKQSDFNSWDELKFAIETDNPGTTTILPLYLYDHSGLAISTGEFLDHWDSGQVGWIYASQLVMDNESIKLENREKILEGEVSNYNEYLRGNIYGYVITDAETGDFIDSVGGFYGEDEAKQEGKAALDMLQELEEQRQQILAH